MKIAHWIVLTLLITPSCHRQGSPNQKSNQQQVLIPSADIRIRDPFVLVDKTSHTYYLYASILNRTDEGGQGVEVYTSKDLKNWTSPKTVFQVPTDFWATKWVWAPEVHFFEGKYYLFTTFTSDETLTSPPDERPTDGWPPYYRRGSQILVSDSPTGPFEPFGNQPHTSMDWMTLDGTLWVEDGQPYMIYCHEWVQIEDGRMNVVALEKDLSATRGEHITLFKASEAPWAKAIEGGKGYITDGCYVHRTSSGKLLMIWSSAGSNGYAIGLVESESGRIKGPWKHLPDRLFKEDGGHGMIFETLEGALLIALHQPNESLRERMQLYTLVEVDESLTLGGPYFAP